MVALLHHQPSAGRSSTADRAPLRLVSGGPAPDVGDRRGRPFGSIPEPGRPRLELVQGVDASSHPSLRSIAAVVLVVLGLLGAIRVLQGSPVPASGEGPVPASAEARVVALPAPGDQVVVARPGDSLWSIAVSLTPDEDPRPVVAALIEANGGDSVRIGQQIVIPRRLLD